MPYWGPKSFLFYVVAASTQIYEFLQRTSMWLCDAIWVDVSNNSAKFKAFNHRYQDSSYFKIIEENERRRELIEKNQVSISENKPELLNFVKRR